MKQFGIDGESFELKVRMCALLAVNMCVSVELIGRSVGRSVSVCVTFEVTIEKTHRSHEPNITDLAPRRDSSSCAYFVWGDVVHNAHVWTPLCLIAAPPGSS